MEYPADGDDLATLVRIILEEAAGLVQAPETALPASDGALHVLPELLELAVEGPLLVRGRVAKLRDEDGLERVAGVGYHEALLARLNQVLPQVAPVPDVGIVAASRPVGPEREDAATTAEDKLNGDAILFTYAISVKIVAQKGFAMDAGGGVVTE